MATKLRPMTDEERRAAGFCICPNIHDRGVIGAPQPEDDCQVHVYGVAPHSENVRRALGLVFHDQKRNRYVSWPDMVESLRQRPDLKDRPEIQMMAWGRMMRMIVTLRDPALREPLAYGRWNPGHSLTEEAAAELVAWAGDNVSESDRRLLLWLAGLDDSTVDGVCRLFEAAAKNALAGKPKAET